MPDKELWLPPSARVQKRSQTGGRYGGSHYGGLTHGGIVNPVSGMGTSLDKTESSFFRPTRFYSPYPLEVLCVQSWAARNFVDYPIDDQFIEWRTHIGDDETANKTMRDAEATHNVMKKLSKAMKAARQYGTGVMVLMTKEAQPETPLQVERIREGDLGNLLVLHRYEMSIPERELDMWNAGYGQPQFYDLHPTRGGYARVHASRVIRFDGITSATDSGFLTYDYDWGLPQLIPVILSLLEDQTIASAMAHLSQEASIPVLKVSDLRAALSGQLDPDDPDSPSLDQIGHAFNQGKSVYRIAVIDKEEEEFDRVPVSFSGVGELLDRFDQRVAAAARIPLTRWMGQSPAGLNATGNSDMMNYVMMVEAERAKNLDPVFKLLDEVLARDAGLREAPEYEWSTLLEMSDEQKATVAKLEVEAVSAGITSFMWDEDEGREMLSGRPVFGVLEGPAPDQPEPEPLVDPAKLNLIGGGVPQGGPPALEDPEGG